MLMCFPGGSEGKESACNAGDPGLSPGLGGSLGEGNGNPFQYSCLENSHGQRSLASPVVLMVKNLPASPGNMRRNFDRWVGKIP